MGNGGNWMKLLVSKRNGEYGSWQKLKAPVTIWRYGDMLYGGGVDFGIHLYRTCENSAFELISGSKW